MSDATPTTPSGDLAPHAQQLAELLAQEERLVLPRLDHDDAWRLGSLVAGLAEQRGLGVVVRVELDGDEGPHTVFQRALAGTTPANDWWLGRKAAVVRHFGLSSFAVGTRFRAEGTTFEESSGLDPERYAAHGGCVPLRVGGQVVGVLGVSGLPQAEDHALAVEGLEAFLA